MKGTVCEKQDLLSQMQSWGLHLTYKTRLFDDNLIFKAEWEKITTVICYHSLYCWQSCKFQTRLFMALYTFLKLDRRQHAIIHGNLITLPFTTHSFKVRWIHWRRFYLLLLKYGTLLWMLWLKSMLTDTYGLSLRVCVNIVKKWNILSWVLLLLFISHNIGLILL